MIKRAHIRQFLALVDEGSFTGAAMRLRVTQPTLSTGIAELERLVATPLFLRERRQVRLTEAGGRFLPVARDLDRGFRTADAFGAAPPKHWPELKLGVIRSVAGDMLQSLAGELAAAFSMEMIEGSDAELRAAVSNGRAQAMLTLLRDGEAGDHVFPLWSEPYVMMARADHPLAGRTLVQPEELASEIMIARRSCELLDATSRFFSQRGVRPRFALKSDSDDRCLRMVAAGMGITTAPQSLLTEGLVPLPVSGYDFSRQLALIADPLWLKQEGVAARFASVVTTVGAKLRNISRPLAFAP